MLIWLAVIIVTVFLDQLTKYLTVLHLKPIDTLPIIEDVFHLTYVENTGAAFGMMKDARWVFMITSTLAIIGILGYMIHRVYIKKEKMPWMEALSLSLILGGGIGNMIDRTMLGYVVDMIDCRLISDFIKIQEDKNMANISAKDVAELRKKTGCGMMECKNALVEANGNMDEAIKILRERGIAVAAKKADRIAAEGLVDIAIEGATVSKIDDL